MGHDEQTDLEGKPPKAEHPEKPKRKDSTHKKGPCVIAIEAAERMRRDVREYDIKRAELARSCGVSENTVRNWLANLDKSDEYRTRKLGRAMQAALAARGIDADGYSYERLTREEGGAGWTPRRRFVAKFLDAACDELGPDGEAEMLHHVWGMLLVKWDGEGRAPDPLLKAFYMFAKHGATVQLDKETSEAYVQYIRAEEEREYERAMYKNEMIEWEENTRAFAATIGEDVPF